MGCVEEERGTIVRCFIVCIRGKKSDGVQRSMGAQGWAVSIREGGRAGAQSRRCGITCNDSANMRGYLGLRMCMRPMKVTAFPSFLD